MQEATPTTLALAGAMGALLCYGWHQRASEESVRPWPWAGPIFWAVAGGLSLGLSLLTLGGFGLIVIPVVILASALPAGRIDFTAGSPLAHRLTVAGLVAKHGGDRRPAGAGDRPDRGTSLACTDGPDLMAGKPRRARTPVLGHWPAIEASAPGPAVRAGAGHPTPWDLRCLRGPSAWP